MTTKRCLAHLGRGSPESIPALGEPRPERASARARLGQNAPWSEAQIQKQVCQQEKVQIQRVQVGVMQRWGQVLETVNEQPVEARGRRCVGMLTRR